jgi:hypothetical protein
MLGTVEHKWGDDDYPALDVRFEDGGLELFWFHELEHAGAGSVLYYDGS